MNLQTTPNTQKIAPAGARPGTRAGMWKNHDRAQLNLAAACMPETVKRENQPVRNTRRRLMDKPVGDLPLSLLDIQGPFAQKLDQMDFAILHGKNPKPMLTHAIEMFRAEAKNQCPHYRPIPTRNMPVVNGSAEFPIFQDGMGIMCASGTEGFRTFRGAMCEEWCVLGCADGRRGDVIPAVMVPPNKKTRKHRRHGKKHSHPAQTIQDAPQQMSA